MGNNNKTEPIISGFTSNTVSGTGTAADSIHVYRDNEGSIPLQGKEYLGGALVNSGGNWSATSSITLSVGDFINATATDASGNTSEFIDFTTFITTWRTDSSGTSNNNQIIIPTIGGGYNYNIYWEEVSVPANNGNETGITGNDTITFPSPGTYRLEITGLFPRIYFNNSGDRNKILSIDQWGTISWNSMNLAFAGCTHLTSLATDAIDLSSVTDLSFMFNNAASFNGTIDQWDVSNITNMNAVFAGASSFNQNLNSWDVSNVINMGSLFSGATSFNGDISNWDVTNVTTMQSLFDGLSSFNQNISNWDVDSVTNMSRMFAGAVAFNQDIGSWDVDSVINMNNMFIGAILFNQDISSWEMSNVTNTSFMFAGANSFNQDISGWSSYCDRWC